MKIQNGRWVDDQGDQLTDINWEEFKSLGDKISSLFGTDITYERINIVNVLSKKDNRKEKVIDSLLHNEELFSKLAGL
jgi:hypothetical protein